MLQIDSQGFYERSAPWGEQERVLLKRIIENLLEVTRFEYRRTDTDYQDEIKCEEEMKRNPLKKLQPAPPHTVKN